MNFFEIFFLIFLAFVIINKLIGISNGNYTWGPTNCQFDSKEDESIEKGK